MPCNTVNSDMFSFMQDTLRIRCPFSYVSIQEGVDSSATTTNTHAERLVQVCHIELNAQGVTEPGQQGSQEDPGLLLDHHGLCHYRLLSEHDVNYTKAANVKLTKLDAVPSFCYGISWSPSMYRAFYPSAVCAYRVLVVRVGYSKLRAF